MSSLRQVEFEVVFFVVPGKAAPARETYVVAWHVSTLEMHASSCWPNRSVLQHREHAVSSSRGVLKFFVSLKTDVSPVFGNALKDPEIRRVYIGSVLLEPCRTRGYDPFSKIILTSLLAVAPPARRKAGKFTLIQPQYTLAQPGSSRTTRT